MLMLILTLAIIGFLAWLLTEKVPMLAPFKMAIYIVAVVGLVIYLMAIFGFADLPVPRLRG